MAAPNPSRQREARREIDELFKHPQSVFVIHYACQSLAQARSPRITAIAARNLKSGDTATYSIHAEIELARLPPVAALSRYDELERSMLDKFFDFLRVNRAMRFVHWNMRDAVFGFPALEHRYSVLGGDPISLAEPQKFDLSRLLVDIYGSDYVPKPYFESLARLNGLTLTEILPGKQEAEAFERGDYSGVQRSALTKVSVLFDLLRLANDRTLVTHATWWTMNVGRVREAFELFERNPVQAVAGLVATGVSVGFAAFMKLME